MALGGLTVGPDNLRVAVAKEVRAAPNIDMHGDELSEARESALYHHYQLTGGEVITDEMGLNGRCAIRPGVDPLTRMHSPSEHPAWRRSSACTR